MEKTFTCVVCPIGCELTVNYDENDIIDEKISVHGNSCPRGEKYAKTELIHPERTLTSIVKCDSSTLSMLPVKTSSPIPKEKLFEAMKLINTITAKAPIKQGDILYKNFVVDGVDLVACRSVKV
ncbi:MAG: DUF1667 domain-containing protein [Ruminococcaceae bacterium]|nr:DUF1667 domain-containing protein [Oscillospiraceae bacterium]